VPTVSARRRRPSNSASETKSIDHISFGAAFEWGGADALREDRRARFLLNR
jgi:hypothetical protein